jgi:polyisoprenoid-binding protein YceI
MATWQLDPMHSELLFKVKHLVISTVTGRFKDFNASLEAGQEDFSDAKISFSADVSSIDTNNGQRDEHLRSEDFFAAAAHPKITFESTAFKKTGAGEYQLVGNLSIRGISKEVTLDVTYGGTMVDPYGNTKAGFELEGKILRKEFGLAWDAVTEAGGVVVSNEVKIVGNIQFAKQA